MVYSGNYLRCWELMTTSLTLIWFSIGALLVMFLSIFIESILWQVIIFAVVSIILLVIATKYLVDRDKDVKYNTNLQGIISQKAIVTQTIEPYETGVAKLNGEEWTAMSKDETRIEVGKLVEVVAIEGVKLIVKEVSEELLEGEPIKENKDSISKEIDIKIKTSK